MLAKDFDRIIRILANSVRVVDILYTAIFKLVTCLSRSLFFQDLPPRIDIQR